MLGWLEAKSSRVLALAALAGGLCVGVQAVMADPVWPTISRSDLGACSGEINVVAQQRIAFFDQLYAEQCTPVSPGDAQYCGDLRGWRNEIAADPLAWFVTANDGEGGAPYLHLFNDPEMQRPDIAELLRRNAQQPADNPVGSAVHCVARVWVSRYDAASSHEGVQTGGNSGEPAQCALSEDETLAQFNEAYNAERARHPLSESAGARAQFQYSYALGTRGLQIIEPLRQCLGRHYAPNHEALTGMRDQGRTGCLQLSTAPQCEPEFPMEGK